MADLIKVSARALSGFWRAGLFWPHEGKIVDVRELGEDTVKRLLDEPQLHVAPAPDGAAAAREDEAATAEAIKAVIGELGPDEFQKDGKPKLDALKERLPELKAKITAALRDAVWDTVKPAD
jgi:hypothetical protein